MGSTRFPAKVMARFGNLTLIEILFKRLRQATTLDGILVATTRAKEDDRFARFLGTKGIPLIRGSREDVLKRYAQAARKTRADVVVRITGDCPLVDPKIVDAVVHAYLEKGVDYASNINPPTFPDGLDVEVFSSGLLFRMDRQAKDPSDREHVTTFIQKIPQIKTANVRNPTDLSIERWTVDYPEDLVVLSGIFQALQADPNVSWRTVTNLRTARPDLFLPNRGMTRNCGANLGTGQKLWQRARKIIPGGNMLLSKRAEMFLPEQWPTYFSRAQGCYVWDLDGKKYADISVMGVGTNILGYGHPQVDEAVRRAIRKGNMSTLNCPEEVLLAEKLVELHPWAEMVRLARSGGEANAIAIRIARAASGKEKVAVCGYHGWHDWYLSANLADDRNLDGHLLPGLEPRGIPRKLKGTVFPFRYNRFEELERLVQREGIGIIKMEVERNEPPRKGYLQKIRNLCNQKGIVLIFDECTSGFRETLGGLHKKYGVNPDMAMFGKALGNGYAITAVVGRRAVMEAAQSTFISSTFWTERIGPAAALKTIEVMAAEKSWEKITSVGQEVTRQWHRLAKKHGLNIQTMGLPSLTSFAFKGTRHQIYKTLVTQEMLARGYLASTSVYVSLAHTPGLLRGYLQALNKVFDLIKKCEEGAVPEKFLKGPVAQTGFRRLN